MKVYKKGDFMEIKGLSTDTLYCIDVNQYNTVLGELDWNEEDLFKIYENTLEEVLSDIFGNTNFNLEVTEFWHPRYYNYEGDKIYFDLTLSDENWNQILETIEDDFWQYVKDYYTSKDGFISLVDIEPKQFIEKLQQKDPIHIGILLEYIIEKNFDIYDLQFRFFTECEETFPYIDNEEDKDEY